MRIMYDVLRVAFAAFIVCVCLVIFVEVADHREDATEHNPILEGPNNWYQGIHALQTVPVIQNGPMPMGNGVLGPVPVSLVGGSPFIGETLYVMVDTSSTFKMFRQKQVANTPTPAFVVSNHE